MLKRVREEELSGFTNWSVELGRRANKEAFEKLVAKLSPKERKELGL